VSVFGVPVTVTPSVCVGFVDEEESAVGQKAAGWSNKVVLLGPAAPVHAQHTVVRSTLSGWVSRTSCTAVLWMVPPRAPSVAALLYRLRFG
jgi:hypothetical protein